MTNNLGTIKIYPEDDKNKEKYLKDIKPGEILFFHTLKSQDKKPEATNKYPGHVGLYLGNNTFIHANYQAGKITINQLDDYWLKKLVASRDLIEYLTKNYPK